MTNKPLPDPARVGGQGSGICSRRRERDGGFVAHHIVLDGAFKKAHAVGFRFAERLFVVPLVMRDAVNRNHHAGAIRATLAMHKHRAAGGVIEQRLNGCHLIVLGSRQAVHGDADVAHAQVLDEFLLVRLGVLADIAEVDDRLDSKLGEIPESAIGGLGATIEVIVYLLKVRKVLIVGTGPRGCEGQAGCKTENGSAPPGEVKKVHVQILLDARIGWATTRVHQLPRLTQVDA